MWIDVPSDSDEPPHSRDIDTAPASQPLYHFAEVFPEELLPQLISSMLPGGLSDAGFIQYEAEYKKILLHDQQLLEQMGLTYEQVAQDLNHLLKKERAGAVPAVITPDGIVRFPSIAQATKFIYQYGNDTTLQDIAEEQGFSDPLVSILDDVILIHQDSWGGSQLCPFCHVCGEPDDPSAGQEFALKNLATGEKMYVSDLIPHLIEAHHFFEGRTPYRFDPDRFYRIIPPELLVR